MSEELIPEQNSMKKYILIQNEGEIESNSFELIGASTKRGEKGKIGFFGSGLKYSIAYMMRNNIGFRIFSGEREVILTTIPEQLKEKSFDRICIDGKPTSYTTTMGPTWTEDWYVLREIYCNALDESDCQLIKETENVNSVEGKTRIYIELTDKLRIVMDNWDKYFSMDRDPLFTKEDIYTAYLGTTDNSMSAHQAISVYKKTGGVLFRRGIQVYKTDRYAFDYGVQYVDINEDRTAKNTSAFNYASTNLMASFPDEHYIKSILRTGEQDIPCYEYQSLSHTSIDADISSRWVDFSIDNLLVVKESSGKYVEEIQKSKKEVFYIPLHFARELKKALSEVTILGMGKAIGNVGMCEAARTPKMEFLLKEVISALRQMNYEVDYPIEVVSFDNEDILGHADVKQQVIYLSERVFDLGRREIAMTLIEESEHIYSGKPDESRSFQNHIFSQWLKSMEEANGLFL